MNIWLQTRRGFGIDLQVVNFMPITLPIDLELDDDPELVACWGIFSLSGYVIRLPFLNIFIGELV